MRYINPNARQLVADRDYALLARGTDSQGNFVHVDAPERLFSEQSLALYEQVRSDQSKALSEGADSAVPLYATS